MGFKTLVTALLASSVAAHPGHEEKIYQHSALPLDARSLDHCSKEFSHPEFVKRTVMGHGAELQRLRREAGYDLHDKREIHERDYISVSKIDHRSNKTVTWNMNPADLFADAGACMLMPAVDQGPLYVQGEQLRKNITEGQGGIRMTLAIQVVDYKTCQVVPNAHIDIWSSNATGMYVGVQGYPGMGDLHDSSILKGTTLRGIQPTDDHGLAVFDTLFPGHYTGRATHIHAIVWMGATKNANNTLSGGKAAHIGQLYFDQSLITKVDTVQPYINNKMVVFPNVQDMLFYQGANGDDPIVRYSLVTEQLADGMFAWIRFGINQGANKAVSPAAWWTKDGGVMNPKGPIGQMYGGKFPFRK